MKPTYTAKLKRRIDGGSFHDQPVHGWPRRRVIWSCDASKGPLLTRYFLIQTRWFALYLHHLQASDEDRALHDHPWSFFTMLLSSGYYEWTPGATTTGPRFVAVSASEVWPDSRESCGWWHVEDRAAFDAAKGRYLVGHYHAGLPDPEGMARRDAAGKNDRARSWQHPFASEPVRTWRRRFSILWRPAEWQHRLELVKPTWTLVLRLRRRRQWGFITRTGWQDWISYGKEWCD